MTNDLGIIDSTGQNRDMPNFMSSPAFQEFAMNQLFEMHKMGSREGCLILYLGRLLNFVFPVKGF